MRGTVQPAFSIRCLISGTAAAASGVFTVTRTISDPASASSMHCGGFRIGRVGHRHRLHDDGCTAADLDLLTRLSDFDADSTMEFQCGQCPLIIPSAYLSPDRAKLGRSAVTRSAHVAYGTTFRRAPIGDTFAANGACH